MFCFVQRIGGHHDDRIEHKRGAPEGVTGHKTPRLPSTLASRCRDYPVFPYKTCTLPSSLATYPLALRSSSAFPHQWWQLILPLGRICSMIERNQIESRPSVTYYIFNPKKKKKKSISICFSSCEFNRNTKEFSFSFFFSLIVCFVYFFISFEIYHIVRERSKFLTINCTI